MNFNNKKYCIYGTGGFGREVLACLTDLLSSTGSNTKDNAVFMVADQFYNQPSVMNVPVIKESEFTADKYKVIIAVGDPHARKNIVEHLPQNTEYTTLIHPSAVVSQWVEIGEGSVITAGVIITCNINIGRHAHLNLHSTVGHDCNIGDYLTTAPGTNISGNCTLGDCVYFGTNSSVRQGARICDNVTVGMGAVVVKDIDEPGTYIGNPLKKLEKK
ncbi:acetyltransferase [Sessilibacter corallicola]|uniref:acetyltransferase n=1 Tax=Sessilibacter corallicola TaxID=2904075 RepID=UPI001E402A90|nr:acetyltransferase [Sessilibacter corallicola]MCE2027912.1 acetyltransferase [Sessilibacter corallicola]